MELNLQSVKSIFKKTGFHFKTNEFLRETYDKEEVFYNHSNFNIYNASKFTIEEIWSVTSGRCYMVCAANTIKKAEWFNIYLQRSTNLKGTFGHC